MTKTFRFFPEQPFTQMLEHIEITNVSVSKAMKKVNPSKSQDPDMIQPKLIKESQAALVEPLTSIFHKSLEEGKIPASNPNIYGLKKKKKTTNT